MPRRWPYPPPDKTEFIVNPGVNVHFVAMCLSIRCPNSVFHVIDNSTSTITVFEKLDVSVVAQINNDVQVLCIAYQEALKWEW